MEENTFISGYEEVKQHLLQDGFKAEENTFVREMTHKQTMVVNGQDCSKELKQRVVIEYLGEGWREEKNGQQKLYGFSIKPDGKTPALDVWASDWEEFCKLTI